MRATGPGKGLGVLPPSWCSGMGQDRPAGFFPALDTFLCAHPRHRCFSLWDELIWGFNSRNSGGDTQNKPTKLKIAHTGCCCFQDKDVTRWALLGLYIKPHHDVASRHYIAPAGRCHLSKPCIADVQGCPCQRSAAGCWGGSLGCAGSPGRAVPGTASQRQITLSAFSWEPLRGLNPKYCPAAQALPAVVLHQEVQM